MKKLIFLLLAGSVMAMTFSSCSTMKRDCNGLKKTKLKNGIYM